MNKLLLKQAPARNLLPAVSGYLNTLANSDKKIKMEDDKTGLVEGGIVEAGEADNEFEKALAATDDRASVDSERAASAATRNLPVEIIPLFLKDITSMRKDLGNTPFESIRTLHHISQSLLVSWKPEYPPSELVRALTEWVQLLLDFRVAARSVGISDVEVTDFGLPDQVHFLSIGFDDFMRSERSQNVKTHLNEVKEMIRRLKAVERALVRDRANDVRLRKSIASKLKLGAGSDLELSSQIEGLLKGLLPTQEEISQRSQVLEKMSEIIRSIAPEAKCNMFGSSASGLGFAHSDVDVAIHPDDFKSLDVEVLRKAIRLETLSFDAGYKEREANIESWEEWLTRSRPEGVFILTIGQVFRDSGLFDQVETVSTARVPVVRMVHKETNVNCDVAIGNMLAVHNTSLLRTYSEISPVAKDLIMAVKLWAKRRSVGDASMGFLSSYGWTLLALFYLQHCPKQLGGHVLPNIQLCKPDEKAEVVDDTIGSFNVKYFKGMPAVDVLESIKNPNSLGSLFKGFFAFYSGQQFSIQADAVDFGGKQIMKKPKEVTKWRFCIIDPFELTHDLGTTLSSRRAQSIINEEIWRAYNLLTRTDVQADQVISELFNAASPVNMVARPCLFCGKAGHTMKQCTNLETIQFDAKCLSCGSKRHTSKECPKIKAALSLEKKKLKSDSKSAKKDVSKPVEMKKEKKPTIRPTDPTKKDQSAPGSEALLQSSASSANSSSKEEIQAAKLKKLTCRRCGQKGHYAAACPNLITKSETMEPSQIDASGNSAEGGLAEPGSNNDVSSKVPKSKEKGSKKKREDALKSAPVGVSLAVSASVASTISKGETQAEPSSLGSSDLNIVPGTESKVEQKRQVSKIKKGLKKEDVREKQPSGAATISEEKSTVPSPTESASAKKEKDPSKGQSTKISKTERVKKENPVEPSTVNLVNGRFPDSSISTPAKAVESTIEKKGKMQHEGKTASEPSSANAIGNKERDGEEEKQGVNDQVKKDRKALLKEKQALRKAQIKESKKNSQPTGVVSASSENVATMSKGDSLPKTSHLAVDSSADSQKAVSKPSNRSEQAFLKKSSPPLANQNSQAFPSPVGQNLAISAGSSKPIKQKKDANEKKDTTRPPKNDRARVPNQNVETQNQGAIAAEGQLSEKLSIKSERLNPEPLLSGGSTVRGPQSANNERNEERPQGSVRRGDKTAGISTRGGGKFPAGRSSSSQARSSELEQGNHRTEGIGARTLGIASTSKGSDTGLKDLKGPQTYAQESAGNVGGSRRSEASFRNDSVRGRGRPLKGQRDFPPTSGEMVGVGSGESTQRPQGAPFDGRSARDRPRPPRNDFHDRFEQAPRHFGERQQGLDASNTNQPPLFKDRPPKAGDSNRFGDHSSRRPPKNVERGAFDERPKDFEDHPHRGPGRDAEANSERQPFVDRPFRGATRDNEGSHERRRSGERLQPRGPPRVPESANNRSQSENRPFRGEGNGRQRDTERNWSHPSRPQQDGVVTDGDDSKGYERGRVRNKLLGFSKSARDIESGQSSDSIDGLNPGAKFRAPQALTNRRFDDRQRGGGVINLTREPQQAPPKEEDFPALNAASAAKAKQRAQETVASGFSYAKAVATVPLPGSPSSSVPNQHPPEENQTRPETQKGASAGSQQQQGKEKRGVEHEGKPQQQGEDVPRQGQRAAHSRKEYVAQDDFQQQQVPGEQVTSQQQYRSTQQPGGETVEYFVAPERPRNEPVGQEFPIGQYREPQTLSRPVMMPQQQPQQQNPIRPDQSSYGAPPTQQHQQGTVAGHPMQFYPSSRAVQTSQGTVIYVDSRSGQAFHPQMVQSYDVYMTPAQQQSAMQNAAQQQVYLAVPAPAHILQQQQQQQATGQRLVTRSMGTSISDSFTFEGLPAGVGISHVAGQVTPPYQQQRGEEVYARQTLQQFEHQNFGKPQVMQGFDSRAAIQFQQPQHVQTPSVVVQPQIVERQPHQHLQQQQSPQHQQGSRLMTQYQASAHQQNDQSRLNVPQQTQQPKQSAPAPKELTNWAEIEEEADRAAALALEATSASSSSSHAQQDRMYRGSGNQMYKFEDLQRKSWEQKHQSDQQKPHPQSSPGPSPPPPLQHPSSIPSSSSSMQQPLPKPVLPWQQQQQQQREANAISSGRGGRDNSSTLPPLPGHERVAAAVPMPPKFSLPPPDKM